MRGMDIFMDKSVEIIDNLSRESKDILSLVQKNGPVTKNSITLLTGIKLSTLNRIMRPLEETNLVIPAGINDSTGGRRPVLFDVNNRNFYCIGIDISRTYTSVAVTNMKMIILDIRQFIMDKSSTPAKAVKLITAGVNEMLHALGIDKNHILGIGLGTVGPLDRENGVMTTPENFAAPGWTKVNIKESLEKALGFPVAMDNGANTAVLGEYLYGAGRGCENLAYFNCGIGIRTGAIASGHIIRTKNDSEDTFGHMVIDVDGEQCSCGNYGCIECYSSIMQITKKFVSELKKGRTSRVNKPLADIDYSDICGAAEKGDALASEVVTGAAAIFGTGLANYINLLNPELIILSGPLIKHSRLFFDVAAETALKKHYSRGEKNTVFKRTGFFGDNSIAAGAAAMVVEKLLEQEN